MLQSKKLDACNSSEKNELFSWVEENKFPSSYYFNKDIYEKEKEVLFSTKMNDLFLGHSSMVNNKGDYFVLPHSSDSKILVHDGNKTNILSNLCKHRHAVMLEGRGNAKKIICPMHHWSYDLNGNLKGSPGFECAPEKHSLDAESVTNYAGFFGSTFKNYFVDALKALRKYTNLDLDSLHFIGHSVNESKFNWKEYVDTYLDDYHVPSIHPGLGSFADVSDVHLEFGEGYQIQCVKLQKNLPKRARAETIPFVESYLREVGEFENELGAIWLAVYPNIMVEVYQDFLVVDVVEPVDAGTTMVHQYEFCGPRVSKFPEVISNYPI